jgi:hypothetical protein
MTSAGDVDRAAATAPPGRPTCRRHGGRPGPGSRRSRSAIGQRAAPQRGNTRRRAQSANIFMSFGRRSRGLHRFFCRAPAERRISSHINALLDSAEPAGRRRAKSPRRRRPIEKNRRRCEMQRGLYTHDTWGNTAQSQYNWPLRRAKRRHGCGRGAVRTCRGLDTMFGNRPFSAAFCSGGSWITIARRHPNLVSDAGRSIRRPQLHLSASAKGVEPLWPRSQQSRHRQSH